MKTRELTRIAFMGALMCCVFQLFSSILYLELITFTIVVFSCSCPRKEAVLACVVFALLNMLFMGINPWTMMYLVIYPVYALILTSAKGVLLKHRLLLYGMCGVLSFLTGQLLDVPFLLFSSKVTLLYILIGLRTSLVQGIISFVACMFLFDPLHKRIKEIMKKTI